MDDQQRYGKYRPFVCLTKSGSKLDGWMVAAMRSHEELNPGTIGHYIGQRFSWKQFTTLPKHETYDPRKEAKYAAYVMGMPYLEAVIDIDDVVMYTVKNIPGATINRHFSMELGAGGPQIWLHQVGEKFSTDDGKEFWIGERVELQGKHWRLYQARGNDGAILHGDFPQAIEDPPQPNEQDRLITVYLDGACKYVVLRKKDGQYYHHGVLVTMGEPFEFEDGIEYVIDEPADGDGLPAARRADQPKAPVEKVTTVILGKTGDYIQLRKDEKGRWMHIATGKEFLAGTIYQATDGSAWRVSQNSDGSWFAHESLDDASVHVETIQLEGTDRSIAIKRDGSKFYKDDLLLDSGDEHVEFIDGKPMLWTLEQDSAGLWQAVQWNSGEGDWVFVPLSHGHYFKIEARDGAYYDLHGYQMHAGEPRKIRSKNGQNWLVDWDIEVHSFVARHDEEADAKRWVRKEAVQ